MANSAVQLFLFLFGCHIAVGERSLACIKGAHHWHDVCSAGGVINVGKIVWVLGAFLFG